MPTTDQPMAAATFSADHEKTLCIKASADTVFDAITTTAGLTAWWATATGSGETGGELKFWMGHADPLVIQVEHAARPALARWVVTECKFLREWEGTSLTFTISPRDDENSELHFRHHGLTAELDCFESCSPSWDHFMVSLRQYAETGSGYPRGSTEDLARRASRCSEPSA